MATVRINEIIFHTNDNYELFFNGYEKLNNATLTIDLPYDFNFAYFDEVNIDDTYYFYLVDWKKLQINPNKWSYSLDLVNPSINLQNIMLPNRAVEKGKPLLETFEQYVAMYLNNEYKLTDELKTALTGNTAQYTWGEPTLYEVFNTLLESANGIITMTDFKTLSVLYLNKRNNDISNLDIKNIITSSDYTNHATKLKSNLQNAISTNFKTEIVNFITPDEPVFNDSRFIVETKHPIEKILKLEYYYSQINPTVGGGITYPVGLYKKDILPYLVEKTVYDTFISSNSSGTISGDYKRTHIYYETGKNYIDGLDYNDKTWIPILTINKYAFEYWANGIVVPGYDPGISSGTEYGYIKITYEAQLNDIAVETTKNALSRVDKRIIMNQEEAFIDLDLFSQKQRLNLERSGNLGIEIYGEGVAPNLMDYYGDYNIYAVKITYGLASNSWLANAKEGFTYFNLREKINSDKKFTMIESPDKAFLSNHINNYDFEFTEQDYNVVDKFKNIIEYFGIGSTAPVIDKAFMWLFSVTNDGLILSAIEPLLEKYGNSLLIHFNAVDNASMGDSTTMPVIGGDLTLQQAHNYVDRNGEMWKYLSYFKKGSLDDALDLIFDLNDRDSLIKYNSAIKKLPYISHFNMSVINRLIPDIFADEKIRYKTNREITAETTQFNLLGNEITLVWDDYFKYIAWGEVKKPHSYKYWFNRDPNKKYTKLDYNFGDEALGEVVKTIYIDGQLIMEVSAAVAPYYGYLITVDNKPIFAYNGSNRALYLSSVYKRQRPDYGDYGVNVVRVNVGGSINVGAEVSSKVYKGSSITESISLGVNLNGTGWMNHIKTDVILSSEIISQVSLGSVVNETILLQPNLNGTGWMNYLKTNINVLAEVVGMISVGKSVSENIMLSTTLNSNYQYNVDVVFMVFGSAFKTFNVRSGETIYSFENPPVRDGYTFDGWYTQESGGVRITLPVVAPNVDTNYYAQYTQIPQQGTWVEVGRASSPICASLGYNPIGTPCSSIGSSQIVSGHDIGQGEGCFELICKI